MKKYIFLAFVILAVTVAQAEHESLEDKEHDTKLAQSEKEIGRDNEGGDREGRVKKIVGLYSQTTLLSILTRTTSSIWTCLSTTASQLCTGRRRRRALIKEFAMDSGVEGDDGLDGSQNREGLEAFVQPIEKIDPRTVSRITDWSTLYTSLELRGTKAIGGSTVTVSALCNQVGGSTTASKLCTGRRQRRALIKEFAMDSVVEGDDGLDGSQNREGLEAFVQPIEKIDQRTGRRITVWSILYSTLELWVTKPIGGSTVTVSPLCNQVGGSFVSQSCFIG